MINKGFQFHFNSLELLNSSKADLYSINKLLDFQPLSIYNCNNMQLLHLKYHLPSKETTQTSNNMQLLHLKYHLPSKETTQTKLFLQEIHFQSSLIK